MRIIITAGGGGHFAPALSVIKKLPKEAEILVIGRQYAFEGDKTISLEYRTAKALSIPFESITTGRLQRSFTRHTLPSLTKLPVGFLQARKIIKKFKPDIILSFGGYVAVPVTFAAYILKIPLVIHEQTLSAGIANKFASKFAQTVCLSWESSRPFFKASKTVLTGNPLGEEILKSLENSEALPSKNEKVPLIYVTGGSLGSHAINLLIQDCIEELVKNYTVFHQTGDAQEFKDYDALLKKRQSLPSDAKDRYILTKFVNPGSVGELIKSSDLVVARAGINTISELIYLNTPGLLIPLPHGQNNEQMTNATFLQKLGLGVVLEQNSLTKALFLEKVNEMIKNRKNYLLSEKERKQLIHTDAAVRIIDILYNVAKKKVTS